MIDLEKALPFWNDLTDGEKKLCEMSAVANEYKANTYLLGQCGNESCLGMIHIISGELRIFILSEEGREITLFRLGAGENCVLSACCVLSHIKFETQINVTKDARLVIVPASTYGKLMKSNVYVRCFTYELATERFSSVMWVMQQILFFGLDKRLASFLLSEYERTKSRELRMTQEEIALAINSVREVVARMLKRFACDGLLESKRGVIILRDINGLEALI